jgi:hypothetical protein
MYALSTNPINPQKPIKTLVERRRKKHSTEFSPKNQDTIKCKNPLNLEKHFIIFNTSLSKMVILMQNCRSCDHFVIVMVDNHGVIILTMKQNIIPDLHKTSFDYHHHWNENTSLID